MLLISEERAIKKEEFFRELSKLYHLTAFESSATKLIDDQFTTVIVTLNYFEMEMLPYSAASKFIYEINDDDVEYFFEFFQEKLSERIVDTDKEILQKATKLIEHLELANSQKTYLFQKQEKQLKELSKKMKAVNESLNQYEASKKEVEGRLEEFTEIVGHFDELNESIHNVEKKVIKFDEDFEQVESKFERIEKSTEQITVNLISILGIFASILLGAYGAVQGFANIFSNANKISLGKILMMSSIGASAVLLILFFLMSSIARLTDRKYGNGGTIFINKHPIMFFSHCILIVVFTAGGVIELIKNNITPQMNWLWIILFILVVIQVLFIYQTKSMWGVFKYLLDKEKPIKDLIMFALFVVLVILVLMYSTGYL